MNKKQVKIYKRRQYIGYTTSCGHWLLTLCIFIGMSALVKFCGVCGDVARSRNFGVLCCESCKSFFRRSVLNKKFGNFRCVGNGDRPCLISSAKRSRCRSCRMNRCLAIGTGKDNLLPSNHTGKLSLCLYNKPWIFNWEVFWWFNSSFQTRFDKQSLKRKLAERLSWIYRFELVALVRVLV